MAWHEDRFIDRAGKIKQACDVCGIPMYLPPSKVGQYKTCSAACRKKRQSDIYAKRTKACGTCGERFVPRPRQLRAGHGIFCSQKCNKKSHAAMNSESAQILARDNWKKRHGISPIVKSGCLNQRWNGGPEAKRERDRLAGWPVQAARRAKANAKFTTGFIDWLGNKQKWKCACCRISIKTRRHIDHITPLKKGGAHERQNIQLLCPPCNMRKQAKDPITFMQEMGFLL